MCKYKTICFYFAIIFPFKTKNFRNDSGDVRAENRDVRKDVNAQ